jgi:hypothetical protein
MPFLALTRAGVASATHAKSACSSLWIGADVLTEAEVRRLRAMGIEVSVFIHTVRSKDEVENAVSTLAEHHPKEPVWVEALPESFNPASSEIGPAFLSHEYIVGVDYRHNESVAVASGPHAGEQGSLVSLVSLEPEPVFTLEAKSGKHIQVYQSSLVRTDA